MQSVEDYEAKRKQAAQEFNAEKALKMLEEHRQKVLTAKAREYTIEGSGNRFEHIKATTNWFNTIIGSSIPQFHTIVLLMCKHLASIDMLKKQEYTQDVLLEKCGDALNYYELLRDMIYGTNHCATHSVTLGLIAKDKVIQNNYISLARKLHEQGAWY